MQIETDKIFYAVPIAKDGPPRKVYSVWFILYAEEESNGLRFTVLLLGSVTARKRVSLKESPAAGILFNLNEEYGARRVQPSFAVLDCSNKVIY